MKFKNHGVKLGERSTDYRANERVGALPYEVRKADGNWESNLPPAETQYSGGGDSMSCVTFAHLNGVETQENDQIGTYTEYSDRWTAKMGNTTREGAYLWQIADAIRTYGLVKESSYPRPVGNWTWDEYHADIPEPLLSKLKAEGQEWLKKWDVKYEVVDWNKASLMKHIKHAPLTVVIPGHAILNFRTTADVIHYFDTYPPHKKITPSVIYAMKLVLYKKEQAPHPYSLFVDLKVGDFGPEIAKLKNALKLLGWANAQVDGRHIELESLPNYYNEDVARYLYAFFLANLEGWEWWWEKLYYRGRVVNKARRDVINNILAKK